ncbi:MAG: EAL domain-containing protein [Gammaproteobacteria bacterium]|nr:EAL domain-containing protein [Gammaproteobacteria bacterium]
MLTIKRLRTRLLLVLTALLASVLIAVFAAVLNTTGNSAERQARQQLDVGANVLERLLALRARELANAAEVLVADFGFRDAVVSEDMPTLASALRNQAARIGADQALFLDTTGRVRVTSQGVVAGLDDLDLQAMQPLPEGGMLAVLAGQPYLLVEALVHAPRLLGQVVLAFALDAELAADMRALTGLEVSFVTREQGHVVDQVATLRDFAPAAEADAAAMRMLAGEPYLTTRLYLLSEGPWRVYTELLSPLHEALAVFDVLKRELWLVALLALVVSLVAAVWLAGSLSRPVSELAAVARRIGSGDYRAQASLQRSDELGLLAQSIDQMRSGIAQREQQIQHNALHDPLTGLANLARLHGRIDESLHAQQQGVLVLLALAETDAIIRVHGQTAFEQMMVTLSQSLQANSKQSEMLAYQPGEGFFLLLEQESLAQAAMQADAALELLSTEVRMPTGKQSLTWLAGLVLWPEQGSHADELLRRVRMAVSSAQPGAERIAVYQSERDQAYQRRMQLIRDLRHAVRLDELSVVFQPKLCLASGQVRAVEALMRWRHGQLGPIGPDEFIGLAEETGSIGLLTNWILEAVLVQQKRWQAAGLFIEVAMNVSTRDLENADFPSRVRDALERHQVAPQYLSLEVTESALMRDPEGSIVNLRRLRELGISLAVDDYGTGYSSLATLKSLPVQVLKIDKSFVLNLAHSEDDAVIVRSTIELAHTMKLQVVAEGIEDETSLNWLREHGCELGQGYFISRPVAAAELAQWLQMREDRLIQES